MKKRFNEVLKEALLENYYLEVRRMDVSAFINVKYGFWIFGLRVVQQYCFFLI